MGLGVAILTVWFYNYFTARLDDITIDIDETGLELVEQHPQETTPPSLRS